MDNFIVCKREVLSFNSESILNFYLNIRTMFLCFHIPLEYSRHGNSDDLDLFQVPTESIFDRHEPRLIIGWFLMEKYTSKFLDTCLNYVLQFFLKVWLLQTLSKSNLWNNHEKVNWNNKISLTVYDFKITAGT